MCHGPEFIIPPLIDPAVIDTSKNAISIVTKGGTPEWVNYTVQFLSILLAAGIAYWLGNKSNERSQNHQIKVNELLKIKEHSDVLIKHLDSFKHEFMPRN